MIPWRPLNLVISASKAKFDETVELHVKLGVDGRHADQQVRGAIVLPNGTGKTVRVLVFCKAGARSKRPSHAGADYAGGMDLVEKIQKENWFEFDTVIATPDMMGTVGRLGKVLGPKGLMPSPKAGTVTPEHQARLSPRLRPVRSSTVWTRPTSSTAPSARSASALRSSMRTTSLSSAPSSRPSPRPPRASTSSRCVTASTMGPGVKINAQQAALIPIEI